MKLYYFGVHAPGAVVPAAAHQVLILAGLLNRRLGRCAAAALLERSWDAPQDFGLSLEATLAPSKAKITVEVLALEVIDALTQVASGSTLSTERALDRHWRNLKVLASHNPSVYKHQILGAYELHGTHPPLGIYF